MLGTIFNTNLISCYFQFLVYPNKPFLEISDFKPKLPIKRNYLENTQLLLKKCQYKNTQHTAMLDKGVASTIVNPSNAILEDEYLCAYSPNHSAIH